MKNNYNVNYLQGYKTSRTIKTLPPCDYTVSRDIERLATFSAVSNNVIIEKKAAALLAASGCIFNAGEDFLECTECGKITTLAKGKFKKKLKIIKIIDGRAYLFRIIVIYRD